MNNGRHVLALTKQFLQLATGLKAIYSYPKKSVSPSDYVIMTYQAGATQTVSRAINNQLLSQRMLVTVSLQAADAQDVMLYTDMIKQASNETEFSYISDSIRQDPLVKNTHIATITLSFYNAFDTAAPKRIFPEEEVRKLLQIFADRLIFNTSVYGETMEDSRIDRIEIPPLTDSTLEEILAMQENIRHQVLSPE